MKETNKAKMTSEEVKELNHQKVVDKVNKDTEKLTHIEISRLILAELIKLNKKIK